MNGNVRAIYQFQINVFNRLVTVSMNEDFLKSIADILDYNPSMAEKWSGFLKIADKCLENPKGIYYGEGINLSAFEGMYLLNVTSAAAKELADSIGCVLFEMRNNKQASIEYPIDVIFAFVKKLEMAGFNFYRELNEKLVKAPRFQSYEDSPIRRRLSH